MRIETEDQLEDVLSEPSGADIESLRRVPGDILILGAGGKMGPSLARRARRAADAAGVPRKITAVSRFSSAGTRKQLEASGIQTISCDLLDREEVKRLPQCPNILFLAGRKFGSSDRADLTWAINTVLPADVADHYRESRIVVFSTGNVYPHVPASSGGCRETDPTGPVGEYAQSCLGRERVFEYYSREQGTPCLIFRLSYAVDLRYGVLVDIALRVHEGSPIRLEIGYLNTLWQGDANSYALRSLEHCQSPPRVLNVTGPDLIPVQRAAEYFSTRFGRPAVFVGPAGERALLSDSSACFELMGRPEVTLEELMDRVAHWVLCGGRSLNKPTLYEVSDGIF